MRSIYIPFHVLASQLSRRVMHLWRHQQSIVTSLAERKQSERDTESMCENRLLIVRNGFIIAYKK